MHDAPTVTADEIRRMLRADMSFNTRVGYIIGLLCTATFAVAILSLWLTEPDLPVRTHIAFAILVVINLSWAVFCGWAVTRKKVLYARQEIIGARLAVTWTAVFVIGALMTAWTLTNRGTGLAAAGLGSVLLACACLLLRRANGRYRRLLGLRQMLEKGMASGA